MEFKHETLEVLFGHLTELLKTPPSEVEREQLKLIPLYTLDDHEYPSRENDPSYFNQWIERLPTYYQRKANLLMEIFTRLQAGSPMLWVVSEVLEDVPQLSHFLLVRYLELFVFKDPLRISSFKSVQSNRAQPEWLLKLMQSGLSLEEIIGLTQVIAREIVGNILAVTDGYGTYGDLPETAPRPQLIEAAIVPGQSPRYLSSVHEYIEDSVLKTTINKSTT